MSNPTAELHRDANGTPVLYLYHLNPEQIQRLKNIMLVNGTDEIHVARSKALAHMGLCDTLAGMATIHLHGEDGEHYVTFNVMLSDALGIVFPNVPNFAGRYTRHVA